MNSAIYQYYPLKGGQLSCIVCGYSYRKDAPLSTLQKHLRVKHQFSIRKPLSTGELDQAIQDAKEPVFSSYVAPGVYVPLAHKPAKTLEPDEFTYLFSDPSSKPSACSFSENVNDQHIFNSRINNTKETTERSFKRSFERSFENTLNSLKFEDSSQTQSSINLTPIRYSINPLVNLGECYSEALDKGNLSSLLNPTVLTQGTSLNSESFEEALVDWILSEKIPLSSVTAPSFQALLHRISPNLVAPSDERLRARLARRFETVLGCKRSRPNHFLEQNLGDSNNNLENAGGFLPPNFSDNGGH